MASYLIKPEWFWLSPIGSNRPPKYLARNSLLSHRSGACFRVAQSRDPHLRILCIPLTCSHSASLRRSADGHFRDGLLARRSVNIKWYGKNEGILNVTPSDLTDYYLVLTGPGASSGSSRSDTRPWLISQDYLFGADELVGQLSARGVKIGTATSVARDLRKQAEVYP